jgi:hypothetical protein
MASPQLKSSNTRGGRGTNGSANGDEPLNVDLFGDDQHETRSVGMSPERFYFKQVAVEKDGGFGEEQLVIEGFSRDSDSVMRDNNITHSVNKVRINEPKVPKGDFADDDYI